jgi:hypothetical protein
MKNKILSLVFIVTIFLFGINFVVAEDNLTCNVDSDCPTIYCVQAPCPSYVCQDGLCVFDTQEENVEAKYFEIWKNILKEENGITDEYFTEHISIKDFGTQDWNAGQSLIVNYQLTINWVTTDIKDSILIKVSGEDSFSNIVTPEVYLEESDVKSLVDRGTSTSSITKINPITELKYGTREEAVEAFKDSTNFDFSPDEISMRAAGKAPREDGNPYFILRSGIVSEEENKCLKGYFSLVSGEGEFWEDACVVTGAETCSNEGEMCGGIAGLGCCSEITCDYGEFEGQPDASGTCINQNELPPSDKSSNLIYWIVGIVIIIVLVILFLILRKKK